MVKVAFHNLKSSETVRSVVANLIESTLEKFPEFNVGKTDVFVSTENAPGKPGLNQFTVKVVLKAKGIQPVILEKSAQNLYQAASLVSHRLLETLHRALEKRRERRRSAHRQFKESHQWAA
jgi:ribosome-associated translation inhibitor RaiA